MGASVLKKALLVILCLWIYFFLQCISYKEDKYLMQRIQYKCFNEAKPDVMDIMRIRLGNWSVGEYKPRVKKWALCLLVRYGLMTRQGVFRLEKALAKVPKEDEDKLLQKINICLYTTEHPPHEIAWNYLKCVNRNYPKNLNLL